MTREQLEHVIRAAGGVSGERELVIVGSQAILATHPDAPASLLQSMEADLYPPDAPEKADLIDGSIGEGSPFHEAFGYYAHGVGHETATLPPGWRARAVAVQNENTQGVRALCPSPADLAASKLLAGRDKDIAFVASLLGTTWVQPGDIVAVAAELPPDLATRVRSGLRRAAEKEP